MKKSFVLGVLWIVAFDLFAQSSNPPIPVELFFGNNTLYSQIVVNRKFNPESSLTFFNMSSYISDYQNDMTTNNMLTVNQVRYGIGKGFSLMAGTFMNSVVGFSTMVGPQYTYSSKQLLLSNMLSLFLQDTKDVELLGIYEYRPAINDKITMLLRLQVLYKQNLRDDLHARSYLYSRVGLKIKQTSFGLAANLDRFGPSRAFRGNYGCFVRYDF